MALPHTTDVIFITQTPLMTIRAFEVMARLCTECEKMFLMKRERERKVEEGGGKGKNIPGALQPELGV